MKSQKLTMPEHLLAVFKAVDQQVAREMQRSPTAQQELGVSKQLPYEKRSDQLKEVILTAFGNQEIKLDGFLVTAKALSESLLLISEELGAAGLGKYRSKDLSSLSKELSENYNKIACIIDGKEREIIN